MILIRLRISLAFIKISILKIIYREYSEEMVKIIFKEQCMAILSCV